MKVIRAPDTEATSILKFPRITPENYDKHTKFLDKKYMQEHLQIARLGRLHLTKKNSAKIAISPTMTSSVSVERMDIAKSVLAGVMVAALTICAIAATANDPSALDQSQGRFSLAGRAFRGKTESEPNLYVYRIEFLVHSLTVSSLGSRIAPPIFGGRKHYS